MSSFSNPFLCSFELTYDALDSPNCHQWQNNVILHDTLFLTACCFASMTPPLIMPSNQVNNLSNASCWFVLFLQDIEDFESHSVSVTETLNQLAPRVADERFQSQIFSLVCIFVHWCQWLSGYYCGLVKHARGVVYCLWGNFSTTHCVLFVSHLSLS